MNCKGFYCNSPRCQLIAYMFNGEAQPAQNEAPDESEWACAQALLAMKNQSDQSCPGNESLKETATSATSASTHPSHNKISISLTK